MQRLVTVLPVRERLLLGSVTFFLSTLGSVLWEPTGHVAIVIKEALFGAYHGSGEFRYAFAILPWFSFNVAASALGEQLGRHWLRGDDAAMERLLLKTAVSGVVIAAILNGAYQAQNHLGYATGLYQFGLHRPFQKWPPSLIYFLCYGSVGVLLILACLRAAAGPKGRSVVSALTTLGQTSFVLFVVQFFVYFEIVPRVRGYLPTGWWPVYFALSIPVVILPALVWHRAGCNRFLTVGYRRWAEERRASGPIDSHRLHPEYRPENIRQADKWWQFPGFPKRLARLVRSDEETDCFLRPARGSTRSRDVEARGNGLEKPGPGGELLLQNPGVSEGRREGFEEVVRVKVFRTNRPPLADNEASNHLFLNMLQL